MLRASIFALVATATAAGAEGVTLDELVEGMVIGYNGNILACKPWASDRGDDEPRTVVVAGEGRITFYLYGAWANKHEFKHYKSLDDHHLIAKTDGETGECTIQVFKF